MACAVNLGRGVDHRPGDKLDIFYTWEEVKCYDRDGIAEMIRTYKKMLNKSYLYEYPEEDDQVEEEVEEEVAEDDAELDRQVATS